VTATAKVSRGRSHQQHNATAWWHQEKSLSIINHSNSQAAKNKLLSSDLLRNPLIFASLLHFIAATRSGGPFAFVYRPNTL
jgi:hypothetical protein